MTQAVYFTIPGPLMAYRGSLRGHLGESGKKYRAYKQRVCALAMEKGWRHRQPTATAPIFISVIIRWQKGRRADWKNIVGAIEDALYPSDRDVDPGRYVVITDYGTTEAVVRVSDTGPD